MAHMDDKDQTEATKSVSEDTSDASDLNIELLKPVLNSENINNSEEVKPTENQPKETKLNDDRKKVEDEEDNIVDPNQILNICSSTAHLIRATISNTLKHRDLNSTHDELENSLIEKLTNLNTVFENQIQDGKNAKQNLLQDDKKLEETTLTEESSNEDEKVKQASQTKAPSPPEKIESSNKVASKSTKNLTKRKVEKTKDQLLKSLQTYTTVEEKFQALCAKYLELAEDYKIVETKARQSEKQCNPLVREKEQLQTDLNRALLARSRLENLCRELQKQNKMIKEESLIRMREEEEKRKEVANKFQTAFQDITTMMKEHQEKNSILTEENGELAKKLKTLVDHYELWEQHMEKVLQQKEVEIKLHKAKLAKANFLMKQAQEEWLREKQHLLVNMSELQKRSTELTTNEIELRTELGQYTSKYEEFQKVLSKSNDVFNSFKKDMEIMTKKIKKLEKETGQWRTKWESCNTQLIEVVAAKQNQEKDYIITLVKNEKLEKLCRALQTERNVLAKQKDSSNEQELSETKETPEITT